MTFWLIVLWAAGAVVLLCGLILVVVVSVQARNRREWRRFGERFDAAVRTHRTEWLRDE